MISDGLLDAIEKGIVTNMKKNFRHKKAVATFLRLALDNFTNF